MTEMPRAKHQHRDFRARRSPDRFGGAMVEFVLALPLLLMLTFGVVDYGYYFFAKNSLTSAAEIGARAAVPQSATNTTVINAISASLGASGFGNSTYTVTTNPTTISGVTKGTAVTVTITATWSNIGVHTLPTFLGGIDLSKQVIGSAVMIKE